MVYIHSILFPRPEKKDIYPESVFFYKDLEGIKFRDITLLYGNNGSGKSTILNIIGEKIGAQRKKPIFKDTFYERNEPYVPFDCFTRNCRLYMENVDENHTIEMPQIRRLITSDDIFKTINDRIAYNSMSVQEIQDARNEARELRNVSLADFKYQYTKDYEYFKKLMEAKKTSYASYSKARSRVKKEMKSNGETALSYFSDVIEQGGIYLLDEPENCLSPVYQFELIKLIHYAAKCMDCQFIIATHSPLILSLSSSVIYNLDLEPVETQKWEELDNVRFYFDFFMNKKDKFNK